MSMTELPNNYQLAIDGPASSGKSTIAKILSSQLGMVYVDTGAMYRAVTLYAKNENISYSDEEKISNELKKINLEFIPADPVQKVLLNGEDVTYEIRTPEITNNVSLVSSYKAVREEMVDRQRKITENSSVVMDGRDIGTTVLPKANLKIYLIASVDERANRRYKENIDKKIDTPLDILKAEIEARDYKDSHREISPLTKADDAIEFNTTGLTIPEVVNGITKLINENIK
jgi:cytidylate kinase